MDAYRFYFLSTDNKFAATSQDIDCTDDMDAKQTGMRLLAGQQKYRAIEIWKGLRRVARPSKG
jgi:hypothetical protein